MASAHRALEVHEPLSTGCYDRHGLDPVFRWVRAAMGDDFTTNLERERQMGIKTGNVR